MKQSLHFLFVLLGLTCLCFIETNAQMPTITSFSPANGAPGTLVTVTGTNFNNVSRFVIAGKAAVVLSRSTTSLVGLVMPGATIGRVEVTTIGGTATSTGSFTTTPTLYPGLQQGGKLTGSGAGAGFGGGPRQGYAVSVSSDGNTAIVGGYRDGNFTQGAVWFFTRTGNTWTQQGSKIVGTGFSNSSYQGRSVAISADGNTAAVGGFYDSATTGAIWVFTRDNAGVWSQQGTKLVGTGAVGAPNHGNSIAISADGNTIVEGGPEDNSSSGAAWIFTRSAGVWTQKGNKLVGTGGTTAKQGSSVAMSADGLTLAIGGSQDASGAGAVWIFTYNGSSWNQQGGKIVGTGNTGNAGLGSSVALSIDGNMLAAGGSSDNTNVGAGWVFTRTGNTWSQLGNKIVATGTIGTSRVGASAGISADGTTLTLGADGDNSNAGAIFVFKQNGSAYNQQGNKLIGSGGSASAQQGFSSGLSLDGSTLISGGPEDNGGSPGAAWAFIPPPPPPPAIAYSPNSNTYTVNTAITPYVPVNTAGAVSYTGQGMVTTFAGATGAGGYTDGTGNAARFDLPRGSICDAQGNVFVADYNNHRIRKITPAGVVSTFAGDGVRATVDGTGTAASFNLPFRLAIDRQNNIYVAENGSKKLRKITPAGVVTTLAGSGSASYADGVGAAASFSSLDGISTDSQGNIYVAESVSQVIRKVTPAGVVSTIAGILNTRGNTNGAALSATFRFPSGVAVDSLDNIYVTDGDNYLIRKIANGQVSTFAGSGTRAIADGTGSAASFSSPNGIVADALGNVYVAELSAIRKITPAGVVTTVAGSSSTGSADGTGSAAGFFSPLGLSIDPDGTIYTADAVNYVIRKIVTSGYYINRALPAGLSFNVADGTISGTPTIPTAAKSYKVTATNAYGSGNTTVTLAVVTPPPPMITSFSPASGQPGTLVTITGANLTNTTNLTIGGTTAIVVSNDGSTLLGYVMPGTTTGPVVLATSSGTATSNASYTATVTPFPGKQLGSKFKGSGSVGPAEQGYSVAVSADGNTAVVGGLYDDSRLGAVWFYTRSGNNWIQQGGKMVGTGSSANQQQGVSVAISADGNTAAVGGANGSSNGGVWIYTRSAGVWTQQAGPLLGTGSIGLANQGISVSLSADGNTLLEGGFTDNNNGGAAWIFRRNGVNWTQQGSKLVGTGAAGSRAKQGISVSLSADASTAIVGGNGDNAGNGAAWIYTFNGTSWVQQGSKLSGTGGIGAGVGNSVALSANGSVAIVGGNNDNNGVGAAWIFTSNGSNYTQLGNKLVGTGAFGSSDQGYAVSISADGNTIVVGGDGDDNGVGAAWVYSLNGNAYIQQGNKLIGTGSMGITAQGTGISLSADGTMMLLGGNGDNSNQGAAWAFIPSASSNANLGGITPSSGTLSPAFAPSTTNYTIAVPNGTSSISITPTVADPNATVTVNGVVVPSGTASASIPLTVGANTITTVVTAADGSTKTYTTVVNRAASSNANLGGITPSSGTLSPAFAPSTTNYTIAVPNGTSSISITPTVADPNATVTVNGVVVPSGTASASIPLTVGANTITTVVTAADGSTKTYTTVVNRAASSNANLGGITPSSGTLSPAFAPSTTNYTIAVPNSTSSISITPTVADPNATVTINGVIVPSGTASASIPLNAGANTITTVVTAADGSTKTYTTVVNRAASSNANLGSITPSSGTLSPAFAPSTTNYTIAVPNGTSSISITPTVADPNATVTVNGVVVPSGSASASIPLNAGANTITTVVTAADGSTKTYTTVVNRAASSNANLGGITPSSGTLSPAFAPSTTNYTIAVPNGTSSISITPTVADPNATVTVNGVVVPSGTASASIPLTVGANTITTMVTAADGSTKTYTTVVNRAASSNANLGGITPSAGTLSPAFAPSTTNYTVAVPNGTSSISITPTVADPNATVTVNGVVVRSGIASALIPLTAGANTITTVVRAADGTTKTYTTVVNRALPSSNANLGSLVPSTGTLSPAFSPSTTTYTVTVPNGTSGISFTPTNSDPNATVMVNGVIVPSGSASTLIPLTAGANTITTVVTAADGSTKTYTTIVNRAASSNADLGGLTPSVGTLSPAFAPSTTNYTVAVPSSTSGISFTPTNSDPNATVMVNGVIVPSGSASTLIPLIAGANTITTVVTAADGTRKTYTTIVNRALPSSNANLGGLLPSVGGLSPAFSPSTTSYSATVTGNVSSVTFTPTAQDSGAMITVNGIRVPSGSPINIPLNVGNNPVTITVTAADGTNKTYTLNVNRLNPAIPVVASNVLTPNGDGKNDTWTIQNIQLYPGNTVTVFDRGGRIIYSKRNYTNDWDGTSKDSPLVQGTYYYVITLEQPDYQVIRGYITILRKNN